MGFHADCKDGKVRVARENSSRNNCKAIRLPKPPSLARTSHFLRIERQCPLRPEGERLRCRGRRAPRPQSRVSSRKWRKTRRRGRGERWRNGVTSSCAEGHYNGCIQCAQTMLWWFLPLHREYSERMITAGIQLCALGGELGSPREFCCFLHG